MADTTETVTERIVIEATLALKNLADLTNATQSFKQKLELATLQAKSSASQWGVSFQEAKNTLASLDKSISGTAESSVVFGGAGQEAWNKVGTAAEEAGTKTQTSTSKMLGGINLVRTALHVLATTAIFAVIGAFTKLFSLAINGLRELEGATYNLIGAERILSEKGIGIKPKDLEDIISGLQKLDPLLSKIQASELTSRVARNVAPQVGFGTQQIKQFTEAVAILAIQNKNLGLSFEEVESQITNAFLTGKVSQGINKLGVKINDQIVKDEALRLGLVKNEKEFDNLTGKIEQNIKARAMLSLLVQATDPARAHLGDYFKTADAQFGIFQARLSDLLTQIGTILAPILIKLFETISIELQKASVWLEKNKDTFSVFAGIVANAVPVFIKLFELVLRFGTGIGNVFIKAAEGLQRLIDKFPLLKKGIELVAKLTTPDIAAAPDTPTAPISAEQSQSGSNYTKAAEELEKKVQDIMIEGRDKRLDIERDYSQKLIDISNNLSDKLRQIAVDTARKQEDALTDYSRKVDDINRDTAEKVSQAQQESHQKEIEAEQKYQQALKDLREKYLLDLEDALHERDARQILRLQRQYKLDKKHLNDTRVLEKQQAKKDLQQKLADIEHEKQLKLEAANRELAEKLADIQLWEQREREDAQTAASNAARDASIAHQRALAEQREFLNRKLRDLANSLVQEYNLTKQGADAIYNLLKAYFGVGGATDAIFDQLKASLDAAVSSIPAGTAGLGTTGTTDKSSGLAEGGTFLATRPTRLNVAENRPELISAVPLGRPGTDINKFFTNAGSGDSGGNIELAVTLSPDLEARVVKQSLNAAGKVIMRINRSK